MIKRLCNHVSTTMHEDVNKHILKNDRSKKRNSSDSYLIAKELVMECVLAPTNENILSIMKDIDSAKYSDIGPYKENKKEWKERTLEIFKQRKVLIANKNYNISNIVSKLYSTIPLVPSNNLIQNIFQDIQYGLYKECGDPEENWDKWKDNCVELLKQRNILSKNLAKTAYHDAETRSSALVYIDGNIYENETHNWALDKYLENNYIDRQNSGNSFNRDELTQELSSNADLNNLPFACLHKINKQDFNRLFEEYVSSEYGDMEEYLEFAPGNYVPVNVIFIETDSIKNATLDEVINAVKNKYPGYEIYEEAVEEPFDIDSYNKLAKSKSNIKTAYHDINDRDYAVLYIDGKFFENLTHNEALTDYTNSIEIRRMNNPDSLSREVFEEEFYNNYKLKNVDYCCLNKVLYDPILNEDVKRIFIDDNTITNISIDSLVNKIKSQYPGYDIYIDNDNIGAHNIDKYKKVAKIKRLKRKASNKILLTDILSKDDIESNGYNTDYGNRSFAISYINGQIYEGDVHKDTVEEYLYDNNLNPEELIDYSSGFVTSDEQEDINLPMACASYIKGIDNNDYICIYPDSLYNVDLDKLKDILKIKYPSAIVCLDNNDRYDEGNENAYIEII